MDWNHESVRRKGRIRQTKMEQPAPTPGHSERRAHSNTYVQRELTILPWGSVRYLGVFLWLCVHKSSCIFLEKRETSETHLTSYPKLSKRTGAAATPMFPERNRDHGAFTEAFIVLEKPETEPKPNMILSVLPKSSVNTAPEALRKV